MFITNTPMYIVATNDAEYIVTLYHVGGDRFLRFKVVSNEVI